MENNLENKVRFFAMHWGQQVMYVGGVGLVKIGVGGWNLKHPDLFLILKSLEDISIDDSIGIARILWTGINQNMITCKEGENIARHIRLAESCFYPDKISRIIDYLRSKGYALPWMGLSVEQLIKYGWIIIIK